jgi:ATP-binding cassette, subfamily B, bacterial
MAEHGNPVSLSRAARQILTEIRLDKTEISSIYFFAILDGLIQLTLPLGIQSIIGFVMAGYYSSSLYVLIAAVVVGVLFDGIMQVKQMKISEKIQQKIFARYSFEFANRIPQLDLHAIDDYYLPELANRFFDISTLQKSISKLLLDIPIATIQIVFGLALLSFYSSFFIFFGLLLFFISFLLIRLTGRRGLATSFSESDYKYKTGGWIEELARVIHSFKFSRYTGLHLRRTDKYVSGYLDARSEHFEILTAQYWALIIFKVLITATMLGVGSYLLVNEEINIGQFIAAEIVIILVSGSVEKLILNIDKIYDTFTALEKLAKVVSKPIDANGTAVIKPTEGLSIEVQNLTFTYASEPDSYIFKNLSFKVKPNENICIMGDSGSGKSSIIRLISGSYRQFGGTILINDLPITNYKVDALHALMGVLLNEQHIFQGTLLENITMGDPMISVDRILEVSDKLGIKQIIGQFKNGLDTQLDPVGRRLPRRTVQRILLLRALVNKPYLLLLEDPFEGFFDSQKHALMDFLLDKAQKQTLIVASNDEEFASRCDRVIFLEGDAIKAEGTWEEVKKKL